MMSGVPEFVNQNTFRSFKIVFLSFSFGCGNMQWLILFSWAPKSLQKVMAAMKLKDAWSLEEKLWQPETIYYKTDITLSTKVDIAKAVFFPVVMYWCESWNIKKAECWRIDAFKLWCWKILLSPLDSKEFKPVNPKRNQPWTFIGRTDAEAETPILWPPDVNSQFIARAPDAGEDWKQKQRRVTEDEMVGWHYWFNGHESEQTLEDSEGQRSMVSGSPWSHRVGQDLTAEWQ